MKSLLLLLVSFFVSALCFAQSNSISRPPVDYSDEQKGFLFGLEYSNLTDLHLRTKSKISSSENDVTNEQQGGTHLGMGGLRFGYNSTPDRGFGWDGTVGILESLHKNEYGSERIRMIIPELNLRWAMTSILVPYLGANTTIMTGMKDAEKFTPGLGGQAGFVIRVIEGFAVNLGYRMSNTKYTDRLGEAEYILVTQVSGLTTNLNYTF